MDAVWLLQTASTLLLNATFCWLAGAWLARRWLAQTGAAESDAVGYNAAGYGAAGSGAAGYDASGSGAAGYDAARYCAALRRSDLLAAALAAAASMAGLLAATAVMGGVGLAEAFPMLPMMLTQTAYGHAGSAALLAMALLFALRLWQGSTARRAATAALAESAAPAATADMAGPVGPAATAGLAGSAGPAATAGLAGLAAPAATVGLAGAAQLAALLALAVFTVTRASMGHAGENGFWTVPLAAEALHLGAVGVWTGAVLVSGWLVLRAPRVQGLSGHAIGAYLERMSQAAMVAVAVIAATGVYNGWHRVGSTEHLLHTAYGWTLLAKVALVLAAIGLGGYNKYAGLPAAARSAHGVAVVRVVLQLESLLLLGALAAAAVLTSQQPPTA